MEPVVCLLTDQTQRHPDTLVTGGRLRLRQDRQRRVHRRDCDRTLIADLNDRPSVYPLYHHDNSSGSITSTSCEDSQKGSSKDFVISPSGIEHDSSVGSFSRDNIAGCQSTVPGRSGTKTTPTKKRQLPQLPIKDPSLIDQELEERARKLKQNLNIRDLDSRLPLSDSELSGRMRHAGQQPYPRNASADRCVSGRHCRSRDASRDRERFDTDGGFHSDASEISEVSVSRTSVHSAHGRSSRVDRHGRRRHDRHDTGAERGGSSTTRPPDGSISDSALSFSITEGRKKRSSATTGKVTSKSSSTTHITNIDDEKVNEMASADRLSQTSRSSLNSRPLGPGQIVDSKLQESSACLGEIQLSLADRKGQLEVEVIRARQLVAKPGAKSLPSPYVKLYLVEGKTCVEKRRTAPVAHSLDPLYQQQFCYNEPYHGRMLQVTVWADFGRTEHRVFMGGAQVKLDSLDLATMIIGWYKLFGSNSISHSTSSSSATSLLQRAEKSVAKKTAKK